MCVFATDILLDCRRHEFSLCRFGTREPTEWFSSICDHPDIPFHSRGICSTSVTEAKHSCAHLTPHQALFIISIYRLAGVASRQYKDRRLDPISRLILFGESISCKPFPFQLLNSCHFQAAKHLNGRCGIGIQGRSKPPQRRDLAWIGFHRESTRFVECRGCARRIWRICRSACWVQLCGSIDSWCWKAD